MSIRKLLAVALAVVAGTPVWATAGPAATPARPPHPPVLARLPVPATAPDPATVSARLSSVVHNPALGPDFGLAAYDISHQRWITMYRTGKNYTPASCLKLLTAAAALTTLGPNHRFSTRVVTSPTGITVVGGGDPTLDSVATASHYPPPATIEALATQTAAALHKQGRASVSLSFDDTLFSGPAVNPAWLPIYVSSGEVAPTDALWVNEGKTRAGGDGTPRFSAPGLAAAAHLAKALQARGITVKPGYARVKAPASAAAVAAVQSPTVSQIVERMIANSDNDIAEVLARQVSIATGGDGSAADAVVKIRQTLTGLGVNLSGGHIYDGSGLTRATAVPLQALVSVLAKAAQPQAYPKLAAVLSGLPVASFDGTLTTRFTSAAARPGGGYVRGKTGTLTAVNSLAGIVVDRGGSLIAYAESADQTPGDQTDAARAGLTVVATSLYRCGCPG